MKQLEKKEPFVIKIGSQEIILDSVPTVEQLFLELVATQINERFNEIKKEQVDTLRTYAYTLLEIAKEKCNLEKKTEEKIDVLETKIASLIEEIDKNIAEYKSK
jgi:hypothetical protein